MSLFFYFLVTPHVGAGSHRQSHDQLRKKPKTTTTMTSALCKFLLQCIIMLLLYLDQYLFSNKGISIWIQKTWSNKRAYKKHTIFKDIPHAIIYHFKCPVCQLMLSALSFLNFIKCRLCFMNFGYAAKGRHRLSL